MSVSGRSSKIPNTEKLFVYLQKEQWQNVSANFSGFVKKEFDSTMKQLEEDEENYKHLKMLIDYAEVGRYNDAKALLDPAFKEFQELEALLRERDLFKSKPPAQRRSGNPNAFENRRQAYTPDNKRPTYTPENRRQTYTPENRRQAYTPENRRQVYTPKGSPSPRNAYGANMNDARGRDIYTPNKQESLPGTPKRPASERYGDKRDIYSPPKRDMATPPKRDGLTPNIAARQPPDDYSPRRYHEVSERSPRTPQKATAQQNAYDDPHRLNYDSLRLSSPEKGKGESPRSSPSDRQNSSKSDHRHGGPTGFDQFASSKDVWGRNEREKPRMGYSTYRQEYPEHPIEHYERQDKSRYRENFGSATEKEYMQHQDSQNDYKEEFRKLHRLQETPDNDMRPSELARRFKDIYMNEWTDAYDEIVKEFGAEKTIRHLLWIVTEAYLIATEIADDQLRNLEERSYSVMSGPPQHRGAVHTRDLGESLPTSRNLLLKYRKQTAALSVPYVKEECKDRICRTLLESSGFPKMYLTDASRVVAYINKCAEVVWLMSVQDPPIVLEYITKDTEGARFNAEHYHTYTSPGSIYKYGVWPLLRLDKRGPIIAKGIAQGVQ